MNKEVLAPNLQGTSLVAMRLVHSSMQAAKCKVADYVVNDALLSSCAHARNRYQMYLKERKAEKKELKMLCNCYVKMVHISKECFFVFNFYFKTIF